MLFLGIDIGTTNTKALLVSGQLEVIAEGSASYDLHFLEDGKVEQNPDDWWEAVSSILRDFSSRGVDLEKISGIAVSGHGCSLVVTDQAGKVLRPAISSLDVRCQNQTEHIRETTKDLILKINGNGIGSFNLDPKLLWLKQNEPKHYEEMSSFMTPTSYITFKLTGKRAVNRSDGGIAMAFDRRNGNNWSSQVIKSIGLENEKYPEIIPCSEVLGLVTQKAAKITGLSPEVPVIAGGEDTSSAALGSGVTEPGKAYISLGTQGTIGVCTNGFEVRPEIMGFPHVLQGMDLLNGSISSCGASLDWFIREWCKDLKKMAKDDKAQRSVYDLLMEACQDTKPGANDLLFLPYLSGELHPILDENAKGIFFGLKLEHTREQMAQAIMEGTAHAIRHNLSFARQIAGEISELYAVGGPTRSALWCQAISDITGCTVKVMETKDNMGGAPLGNVLLLMSRLIGADVRKLLNSCLSVYKVYEPSEQLKPMYERHHKVYKKLYRQVKELYPLLKSS